MQAYTFFPVVIQDFISFGYSDALKEEEEEEEETLFVNGIVTVGAV